MTFFLVLAVVLLLVLVIDHTPLRDLAVRLLSVPVTVSERQAAANSRPTSCAVTALGAAAPPTSSTSHLPQNDDGRALERPAV
jgi:hypothetical protein